MPRDSHVLESILRKNRNLFTAGEDNLVLRGVNLYGEKQWMLIADRFLPERSVNIISQRYAKLCYLLYKAHGIKIDKEGNLADPPKLESVDDLDEVEVGKLQRVQPPAILNVHRWSIEEDLTLLKAVALMGSMWAELRARLIPHRDRGHLRKRYQVLERRVKATAARVIKHEKFLASKMRNPIRMNFVRAPPENQIVPPFSPATAQGPAVIRQFVPVIDKSPPPVRRAMSSLSKLTTTKRCNIHHKQGQAVPSQRTKCRSDTAKLPIETFKRAAAGKPSLGTARKQAAGRSGPSETVNQAAAILAHARVAPPYHHPAYLYQPPPGYHPHMYPYFPNYYPGYTDEGSRAAFERLAHDPGHDWSQSSHVKRMMENETESMVASTIVTQLAKSPAKPFFSDMEKMSAPSRRINHDGSGSDSRHSRSVNAMMPATHTTCHVLKVAQSPSRSFALVSGTYDSPSKRMAPPFQLSASDPAYMYASPGTPLPLHSPGFSPPSGLEMHNASPWIKVGTFVDGNSPFMYRDAEYSRNGHSMDGYDLNGVFSNAASEGCKAEAAATDTLKTPETASSFSIGATLMENDLEAIAALNSLSQHAEPGPGISNDGLNLEQGVERKSLFAQVVGRVKEKEKTVRKKRKLR